MRVLLFLLLSLITSLSTFSQDFLCVSSLQLNLRDRPTSSSNVLGTYSRGSQVEVFTVENGWAVVRIEVQIGYMLNEHLTDCAEETVLICDSSSAYAYHNRRCQGLNKCKHPVVRITKKKAIQMGRRPCRICY